ncbi:MAG: hypothetical protein HQK88_09535 [Nitrospirae bacterium]|nr:hypothetical protein [Nitrospirota bacterium]MBF0534152.1 hypothetical protein [Nitrospirota bacterium]MBF0617039.1 hypothetical protein [Nitrospirota bacterium]
METFMKKYCFILNYIVLLLLMILFVPTVSYADYGWTVQTGAGTGYWFGIASSSDGTKLAAVAYGGSIYTSTDSGATWTEQTNAGSRYWYSIASSSDGTKLAAGNNGDGGGGYIYTSTDSGATWFPQTSAGIRLWSSITSSSDGTKLAAVDGYYGGGYIYSSTDSGATWIPRTNAGSRSWWSITSSTNGLKLAVGVIDNGYIYTSINSGETWTPQTNSGSRYWYSIASSSDGSKLAAAADDTPDYIYTSTDSGATWTTQTSAGSRDWYAIASSSDGSKLAAVVDGGYIYISTDSGATWTEQTNAGSRHWYGIAASSDGTKFAAIDKNGTGSGGFIYTGVFGSWTVTESLTNVTTDKISPQGVVDNGTITFQFTPASGFRIISVSGCGGTDPGVQVVDTTVSYTTGAVTADCTVTATASHQTYAVTPSAGAGGSISPNTAQTVNDNTGTSFTITPNTGYSVSSVEGTCGGSLSGTIYTTSPVTFDCSVVAYFSQGQSTVTYDIPYLSTNSSNPSYCMASNRSSQDLTVKFTVGAADNATPSGTTNTFANYLASKKMYIIKFSQNTISLSSSNNETIIMSDTNNASLYGGFLTFTSTAVYTSGTEARCKSVLLECYQGTFNPKRLMTGQVCENGYYYNYSPPP